MSRVYIFFSFVISMMITSYIIAVPAHAQEQATQTTETTTTSTTQTPNGPVTVQRHVITTTVPAAKEVIATPAGYVDCAIVPAAWVNDIWIPEHRVCKYENSTQGVAWVDGYWSCTQYKIDTGECTTWKWVAAHWEKTYSVY